MNKREVKAIAEGVAKTIVARHERVDHPGEKGTTNMHNEGKISEARKMVEEHREKEHHMVGQHAMSGGMRHGEHKVPGSGAVPPTPTQPRGGEPHPKDHEGHDVDG